MEALSVLEPDFIKIDRSLICNITLFPGKQRMLHLLVDYMGSGHAVVAEGVETQDDLLTIKELRLALSQGYFWSKPLSSNQVIQLLDEPFGAKVFPMDTKESQDFVRESELRWLRTYYDPIR